jgi:anaerobic selenocysteine-containing dehydrogenase
MATEVQTFCRFCHSFCGITVTVADGIPVKVVGDVDNPMYEGYSCIKGRALPEQHTHPDRLLHSMKRTDDGFVSVTAAQAMDEIAARIADLVAEHGPRSVALYTGTFSFMYPTGADMAKGFMAALGSPMRFSSGAIDQPGKGIARALHGTWSAGPPPFDEADTWMLVGANPVVSMWGGIPQYNPAKRLREAKGRGMKLVVIDPRVTECAKLADIHLQCRPGEDPTILAGILRAIIADGLHDAAFVDADTVGFEALRAAVEPFMPEYVEARADVPADQLVAAARMFAAGRSGSVTAGTGPNMAPRGTLTEYLIACIQSVCGRWLREGDPVPNPFVLLPAKVAKAQADPKIASHGYGEHLRIKGLTDTAAGMPTAALADEILTPGDGQVRALICLGGNPVAAWPDQLKAIEAMEALELAVTLDIKMSATAKLCDYVIAPKLSLEAPSTTMPNEGIWGYGAATTGYPEPYAQFAPVVVDPPGGSDVIEEWEFFYGLGQRLGLALRFAGVELDMANPPTSMDLLRLQTRRGRVSLDDVMAHPHGAMFPDPTAVVLAKDDHWPERLDLGHPLMMAELAEVASEPLTSHGGYSVDAAFTHRLISRRLHEVYNSSGRDIDKLTRRYRYNPAFMHPDDLAHCGFSTGDVIEIDSGHASILGVVEAAPDVKYGCISMAHSFGDTPKHDGDVRLIGSNTGRLSDFDATADPITGIPWMSAIPVNVRLSDESFALA